MVTRGLTGGQGVAGSNPEARRKWNRSAGCALRGVLDRGTSLNCETRAVLVAWSLQQIKPPLVGVSRVVVVRILLGTMGPCLFDPTKTHSPLPVWTQPALCAVAGAALSASTQPTMPTRYVTLRMISLSIVVDDSEPTAEQCVREEG